MRAAAFALAVLALSACAGQGAPSDRAVADGRAYAVASCGSCHAVAGAISPNPLAPSFDTIANTPGMTGTALNVWLHSAHESMPNYLVHPRDVETLAAYLETLRRPTRT